MGPKEGVKHVAWDADIVDGRSSWDVLLAWLADGNYDRWVDDTADPKKIPKKILCHEFSDLLKARGYRERSAATTFHKIWTLERSVGHAKHLLEEAGQAGLESLEGCHEELSKTVLRYCPYFAQLAPIMKSLKSSPLETFSSKKPREQGPAGRRRKRTKHLAQCSAGLAAGVNGEASPSYDDDASPSDLDDEEQEEERVDEPEHEHDTEAGDMEPGQSASNIVPVLSGSSFDFDLSPLQQQELEDRCMRFEQHHERNRIELESERSKRALELEALRKKHDSELEALRQRLEIDVETARAKSKIDVETAECDLELTRAVNATSLATERALSRQKLIKAGISQQEVDRLLPSKPCSS